MPLPAILADRFELRSRRTRRKARDARRIVSLAEALLALLGGEPRQGGISSGSSISVFGLPSPWVTGGRASGFYQVQPLFSLNLAEPRTKPQNPAEPCRTHRTCSGSLTSFAVVAHGQMMRAEERPNRLRKSARCQGGGVDMTAANPTNVLSPRAASTNGVLPKWE